MDDVVINKAAAIERAVRRVREEHAGDDAMLLRDQTKQDSVVLNLQRACESAIDLAMHLVRCHRLGVPESGPDRPRTGPGLARRPPRRPALAAGLPAVRFP